MLTSVAPTTLAGDRIRARRVPGTRRMAWVFARAVAPARAGVAGDVLEERPPGEDVDRLEPAADAEDRHPALAGDGPGPRLELVAIRFDVLRAAVRLAVALRVEVRAARHQQPVHRPERGLAGRPVDGRIERDRLTTVAGDPVEIELVLARGDVRLDLPGGDGERDDDAWTVHGRRIARRLEPEHRPEGHRLEPGAAERVQDAGQRRERALTAEMEPDDGPPAGRGRRRR